MRKTTKALIVVAIVSGGFLIASKKQWFDLGETLDLVHERAEKLAKGAKLGHSG